MPTSDRPTAQDRSAVRPVSDAGCRAHGIGFSGGPPASTAYRTIFPPTGCGPFPRHGKPVDTPTPKTAPTCVLSRRPATDTVLSTVIECFGTDVPPAMTEPDRMLGRGPHTRIGFFHRKPGPTLREAGGTNFPSTHENTEPPFPKERPAERPVPQPLSPFRNRFILPVANVCEGRPTVRGEREPPGPSHRLAKKGGHDFESVPCSPAQSRVRPLRKRTAQLHDEKRRKRKFPEWNFRFRC